MCVYIYIYIAGSVIAIINMITTINYARLEKGLCGLSQNNNIREHSRRNNISKLGIFGGAQLSGNSGVNPIQSNPLEPCYHEGYAQSSY